MSGWTDGWEDDDVDLDDDDDIFVEEEEDDEVDNQRGASSGTGVTTMGPGILMGRLTQIISQVAAPQITEEHQQHHQVHNNDDEHDQVIANVQSKSNSLADRLKSLLTASKGDTGGEGWDDDLEFIDGNESGWGEDELDEIDVDEIVDVQLQEISSEKPANVAEKDNTEESSGLDAYSCLDHAAPRLVTEITESVRAGESANGWDDSLCLDDDVNEHQGADGTPRARVPSSPSPVAALSLLQAQYPPPSIAQQQELFVSLNDASNGNSGWEDPDLDTLNHIDEIEIQGGTEQSLVAMQEDVKNSSESVVLDASTNDGAFQMSEGQGGSEDSALEALEDFDRSRSPLSQPLTITSSLVDQVPLEAAPVILRDSTLAMASDQSGTLGEESYPDEQYYGLVVDQLPPPFRPSPVGTLSILTQVRFDEMDQDDNEVGEDTAPGETSEEAINGANAGPVVVDHVPLISAVRVRVRDSTLAVASEQSSTVMEDIWREDFAPNDEDYGPVVDHLPTLETPSPSVRSIRSLSSLAVQRAITEEDDVDDEDANELPGRIGPFSGASIADSMAVIAPIAEIEEDNTVGQATYGIDGDTFHDDETVSNAPLTADGNNSMTAATREEPLVDHVPLHRRDKPTDASTLVLADPSEVSTVGDMTYEDMQFGLVVDHTPPPRQLTSTTSGTASILVAATKSECPDDLEDDMDGETYAMGTGEDGVSLDSTIAEQNQPDDKLVDHVPEGHTIRRVTSASAIAEAQSVISTNDDEFGLVVDHTPIVAIGSANLPKDSVGALATLSECETLRTEDLRSVPESVLQRRIEVDALPVSSTASRGESTVTIKSVGETADGDTIDEMSAINNFGLVVDHLPSAGTPIPASRGGSTAGALATLSEADFDANSEDADVWEDDDVQDGVTVGTIPKDPGMDEFKEETPETKIRSVTFQNLEYVPMHSPKQPAMVPDPSYERLTMYSTLDGEDDSNVGKSTNGSVSVEGSVDCRACAESGSLDCPCIQRILAYEGDKDAAVVRRMSPDGIPVDIDYSKLLQDEVTKRILLEKEVEKYQDLVNALQSSVSETTVQSVGAVECLEPANKLLIEKLGFQVEESKRLQNKVLDLESHLASAQRHQDDLLSSHPRDVEAAVQIAVGHLMAQNENVLAETISEHQLVAQGLAIEIELLKEVNISLSQEVLEVTEKCKSLQDQYDVVVHSEARLRDEIADSAVDRADTERDMLSKLADKDDVARKDAATARVELSLALEKYNMLESNSEELAVKLASVEKDLMVALQDSASMESKESSFAEKEERYRTEIMRLQEMISDAASASELEIHLKSRISTLEIELSKKADEAECLNTKVNITAAALQESEAKAFVQIKESARLSKRHEIEVSALRKELDDSIQKCDIDKGAHLATIAEERERSINLLEDLRVATESKDELKKRVHFLLAIAEEKDAIESMLTRVRAENASLTEQLEHQRCSISQIKGERDLLQESVATYSHQIRQLHEGVAASVSQKDELETAQTRLLEAEKANEQQVCDIVILRNRIESLEDEIAKAGEMSNSFCAKTDEIASQRQEISNLKARLNGHVASLDQKDLEIGELQSHLSSLSDQLAVTVKELSDLEVVRLNQHRTIEFLQGKEKEHEYLLTHCESLERRLEDAVELQRAEGEHLRRQDEIEVQLRVNLDTLLMERDSILNEMRQHEEDSEDMLVQLGLNKEQMDAQEKQIAALHDALRTSETNYVRATDHLTAAEEDIRRLERHVLELQVPRNDAVNDQDSEKSRVADEVETLTRENADLQQQLDDLNSAKAYTDEKLDIVEAESESLREQCRMAETKILLIDNLEEARQKWQNKFNALKTSSVELEESFIQQKFEIDRLVAKLKDADASALQFQLLARADCEKVHELDRALECEHEKLLDSDHALKQAHQQLQDLRRMADLTRDVAFAEMSQKIYDLNMQIRQSQQEARSSQNRVLELETALAVIEVEFERTRDALSKAENTINMKEIEMKSFVSISTNKSDLEKAVNNMKEDLATRDNSIHVVESQRAEVEERSIALAKNVEMNGEQLAAREREINILNAKILQLENERTAFVYESNSRDENARQEVAALRIQVEEKQNEMANLRTQARSLSHELSTAKNLLSLKEEELQRVSLELEETCVAQLESTQRVTAKVLQSEVSKPGLETTENMRKLVITLSQALEKSESQRADAIDRLLRERKTNADSLKRLGESVKRFYTTLNGTSP